MLELLAANENLTVSESAHLMGLNRSVAHRLLATLYNLGYVHQGKRSQYSLSMKLFELGSRVVDRTEIRAISRPFMQSLVDIYGETVNLGLLDGQDIVVIDTIAGWRVVNCSAPIGSRSAANSHAMGKAILVFSDLKKHHAYVDAVNFDSLISISITDFGQFLSELDGIRHTGYAIDNEELVKGVKCVAAPVFDHTNEPIYSISILGSANRLTLAVISKLSGDLIQCCHKISNRIGSNRK